MEDPEPFPPGGRSFANHPPQGHWFDTVERNANSQLTYKGLRNAPGENNCFLNSAVQVFWHLDVFRRSYRRLTGHLCMGNSCIFCALKVIFTQFQYSDQSSLPPDALRKALADTFMNQQRFQLGHMDDAAECFENILRRIHFHIANAYHEDSCAAAHCLPHQKFAMTVFDQLVCVCGASSEPLKFHELVHYINTNALVSQYRSMQETGDILHPDRFGLLLRNGGAAGDIRDCPGNCGKRVQIRRTLINSPDVVSIGLVWDSDRPSGELINDVARSIGTSIHLQDVFHSVMNKLSALVCYYGKHYSTFVYHTKLNVWIYFDDATVKEIGPRWEHVVEKCSRGRYQPLLLLYTNPNASPICTDTAPKKRVMAPGYATPTKGSLDNEKKLDLKTNTAHNTRNLSSDQRQVIPGPPDLSSPDAETPKGPGSEHRRQPSFLIAITGKNGRNGHKSEYAVPTLNAPVKQMLPGGQGQFHGRSEQGSRSGPQRSPIQQDVIEEDTTDGYNYTLSNSDQYRRPSLSSSVESNKGPLAVNFTRNTEAQRKESFKKNKNRVGADVVRYHMDPRRSSSSDSDSPVSHEGAVPPQLPPKRNIVHSQSFEESPANISADNIDMRQHIVIKPKPNPGHMYENIENLSHTPVQSGLATLPRKSKSSLSQVGQHSRQGSVHDDPNAPSSQGSHSRQSSTNTLTESHSRQSSTHTLTDHSRQNSSVSQHSEIIQQAHHHNMFSHPASAMQAYNRQMSAPSTPGVNRKQVTGEPIKKEKPPKPAKPEKKSSLLKKKSGQPQQDQPPPLPDKKKPRSPNADSYIDRKMVESVLSFQTKLSRQGSTNSNVSHSSNTSFDSDNCSMKSSKDGHMSDNMSDTMSVESHRDSGYGSSDRNSSSSTGSTTLDPFSQYFLSKSMIPPKTINQQVLAEGMKKLMNPSVYRGEQSQTVMYQYGSQYNPQNSANDNMSRPPHGDKYGPCVYTGQDGDKPFKPVVDGFGNPIDPSSEPRKQLYDPAIVKSHQGRDGRANPLPPRIQPTGHQPNYSGGQSNVGVSEPPGTVVPVNDQFMRLCQQSEDLMDTCVLAETDENYPSAINYCNNAIDKLKQAMKLPNIPQQCFTFGQKKHNSCLLKLRSLQKKSAILRQESNSSTTSSDSARSSPMTINSSHQGSCHNHHVPSKGAEPCLHQNVTALQQTTVHSRSSSRDSVDSVIENKNYRPDRPSSANSNSSQKQVTSLSQNSSQNSIHERTSSNSSSVDIYATLPRKQSRKPPSKSQGSSSVQSENYSNRQKSSSVHPGQGHTPPVLEKQNSDSSMESQFQIPAQHHIRTNVAEIRPLQQTGASYPSIPDKPRQHQRPSGTVTTEVCKTPTTQQQTAKTLPVTPPKPRLVTQSSSLPPKQEGNGEKDGAPVGKAKTSTYRAGTAEATRKGTDQKVTSPNGQHYNPNHLPVSQSDSATHSSSRPTTPQPSESSNQDEDYRPSVRDLASRFGGSKSKNVTEQSVVHSQDRSGHTSIPPELPPQTGSLQIRQRSKSESDFRNMQENKPKSVLSKNKKHRGNKPRKSVTFCDNIALISAADLISGVPISGVSVDPDMHAGYVSDEEDRYGFSRGAYSDNELEEGDSSDSPVEIFAGEEACNLCGKKGVMQGQMYCPKCYQYMNRFQQRT
ncbi:hypothetical protein FSP39_021802 [Pinctada imbricata]|uniref:USP domain-containing protein n=1 Tax=Pinctada imbricata TaxID=66713 RepID=A0AA89BXY1_PINIB|nr:hypothetical protein FSP39_021802 [Pinctada imbricata]